MININYNLGDIDNDNILVSMPSEWLNEDISEWNFRFEKALQL